MKSSINVRYNVYAPKAERKSAPHLNRATQTVYPLGSKSNYRAARASLEQMHLGHASIKQRCEIQCEALAFSDEHK